MYKTVQDAALWQLHYVQYGLVAEPTMVVSTDGLLLVDMLWLIASRLPAHERRKHMTVKLDICVDNLCRWPVYGNYTMCNLTLHQNPLRQQVRPT